jgi:translation initiation factor 2 gamma subunit (eIF-2gamma)
LVLKDVELELVLAFVEAKLSAGLVNVAEDIEVEVELFEVLLELAEDCNVDRIRNEEIIDIESVSVVGGPV